MSAAIQHRTEGLARPCNAWDLFSVTGGLQCGNCLAHNVPPDTDALASMAPMADCDADSEESPDAR